MLSFSDRTTDYEIFNIFLDKIREINHTFLGVSSPAIYNFYCIDTGPFAYFILTHYSPVLLFYTPWKHQKICRFSDVFSGYRKAVPGSNGLLSQNNVPSQFYLISLFSLYLFETPFLIWDKVFKDGPCKIF